MRCCLLRAYGKVAVSVTFSHLPSFFHGIPSISLVRVPSAHNAWVVTLNFESDEASKAATILVYMFYMNSV